MINNEKIFVPPIKIQGIKTKLVLWIKEQVKNIDYNVWIEPFMGSGVVGFNIRPKQAIFCDINPYIIDFYNSLKNKTISSSVVRKFLEAEGEKLNKTGADYYYFVRERFNKYHDPLDFLFLNRSSFNGLIRFNGKGKFNTPFGHKPQRFSKAYITKIVNQIKYIEDCLKIFDWQFINQDFRESVSLANQSDLVYCDPPYIGRHTNYFDDWSEKDEKDLYNLLSEFEGKFILSTWLKNRYRENEFVQKYWQKFNLITKEHFYFIGAKETNRNSIIEALVLNFQPSQQKKLNLKQPQQLRLSI